MTDSERLQRVLEFKKLNVAKFAREIGLSNRGVIDHVLKQRNKISEEFASKVIEKYPDINYNWLLNGSGEMINIEDHAMRDGPVSYGLPKTENQLFPLKVISDLTDTIKRLEKEIDELKVKLIEKEHNESKPKDYGTPM